MLKKPNLITAITLILSIIFGFLLLWVIYNLDPLEKTFNLLFFYSLAFLFSLCVSFAAGFLIRKTFGSREFIFNHLAVSIRQATWLALLVLFSLILSSFGIFNWWNSLILAGMFIFLEAYFLYQK